jgi:hypothetical protein
LSSQHKRKRDVVRFSAEDLENVKSKIAFYTSSINLFLTTLGTSSLGRIEKKLDEIVDEIRRGDRDQSIVALQPSNLSGVDIRWDALKDNLVHDGFTQQDIEAHKDWIRERLQQIVQNQLGEKADRRAEIERRCLQLDPPILPSALVYMSSFHGALQVPGTLNEGAWDVLRPRLLAQKEAAEKREQADREQVQRLLEQRRQHSMSGNITTTPLEQSKGESSSDGSSIRKKRPFRNFSSGDVLQSLSTQSGDDVFSCEPSDLRAASLEAPISEPWSAANAVSDAYHISSQTSPTSPFNPHSHKSSFFEYSAHSPLQRRASTPSLPPTEWSSSAPSLRRVGSDASLAGSVHSDVTEYDGLGRVKRRTITTTYGRPEEQHSPSLSRNTTGNTTQGQTYMMTFETEKGPMTVPVEVDVQQASKLADEKRKRNAGASARFRARRKDKEKEFRDKIESHQKTIRELQEEAQFYFRERNFYRDIVAGALGPMQLPPRPPSPNRSPLVPRHSAASNLPLDPALVSHSSDMAQLGEVARNYDSLRRNDESLHHAQTRYLFKAMHIFAKLGLIDKSPAMIPSPGIPRPHASTITDGGTGVGQCVGEQIPAMDEAFSLIEQRGEELVRRLENTKIT